MTSSDDFVLQLIIDRSLVSQDTVDALRSELEATESIDTLDGAILAKLIDDQQLNWLQFAELLAEECGAELVRLQNVAPQAAVLEALDAQVVKRYKVFPLEMDDYELHVAVFDPLDIDAIDNISHLVGRSVTTSAAPLDEIELAIQKFYDAAESTSFFEEGSEGEPAEAEDEYADSTAEASEGEEAPIIRFVRKLIGEAMKRRASDIHLEPLENRFRIRYRIDGVLHEIENPPKRLQPAIISRLKLMSDVSIAEKRVPQDGRINITIGAKVIDLRVSTLPTAFGESIVMRILDKESLRLGLPELGFFSDDQENFERVISLPDGIFLVTGPTGSGKSTTLYSALNCINNPDRKIITVEDPVEYELSGVNQVQVQRDVGMTFSAALRSMLRQAPNIIMVGEIRDKETAEISVNASLTGHMVFSTLHTNDAPSAVSRLVDIGIKPFLVAASVRAVLAQRLVRKNCPHCKESYQPSERLLDSLGLRASQLADANFMHGTGCDKCGSTGFRGRVGVFELFNVNEELQSMVYEQASLVAMRKKAREMGMRSMREDGIRKVLAGVTTPEEVLHATVVDSI